MRDRSARVLDIEPRDLASLLSKRQPMLLLDVREPWEREIASLTDARLIPLGALNESHETLPRDQAIVVLCHHGVRSMVAAQFLVTRGFDPVYNVTGGIERYALDVDPRIPRY